MTPEPTRKQRRVTPVEVRALRYYTEGDPADCWEWGGTLNQHGYGVIGRGRRGTGVILAHRLTYELTNGAIGDGLQIDHLCRNRRCVNPSHLEAVVQTVNLLRQWEAMREMPCACGAPATRHRGFWRACDHCLETKQRWAS